MGKIAISGQIFVSGFFEEKLIYRANFNFKVKSFFNPFKGLLNRHISNHLNSREELKLVGFSVSMHDKNRLQITSQKSKFGVRTVDVQVENNRIKSVDLQVMESSNYFRPGKIITPLNSNRGIAGASL